MVTRTSQGFSCWVRLHSTIKIRTHAPSRTKTNIMCMPRGRYNGQRIIFKAFHSSIQSVIATQKGYNPCKIDAIPVTHVATFLPKEKSAHCQGCKAFFPRSMCDLRLCFCQPTPNLCQTSHTGHRNLSPRRLRGMQFLRFAAESLTW